VSCSVSINDTCQVGDTLIDVFVEEEDEEEQFRAHRPGDITRGIQLLTTSSSGLHILVTG